MRTDNKSSKAKILVLITGSIAAVRIPLLVSQLVKDGFEVKCVISENAEKLIQPLSMSILSRNPSILEKDQWSNYATRPLHIDLCDWADILIVAPLTATSLSKWVTGNADGLIASILIANTKPVVVAPAMNTKMWFNQAVKKNHEILETYNNVLSLEPSKGILACDEVGIGKIPNNDLIQLAIEFLIINNQNHFYKDLQNKEFLITGGCTLEKIDAARNVTNSSSGTMGLLLAQVARFRGANVKYIHGPLKIDREITEGIKRYEIETSLDLRHAINKEIENCDYFFMNAAVSDFKISTHNSLKIPKCSIEEHLKKNFELVPDILREICKSKKHNQTFIGFSAYTGSIDNARKIIQDKIMQKGCDYIFANPIDVEGQGFGSLAENEGWLFDQANCEYHIKRTSKIDLANKLISKIV